MPRWLSGVLSELELDRPTIVTGDIVAEIRERLGVKPATHRIVEELRRRGWLLDIGVPGAWEFAPAERAGAISSGDPFLPLRATLQTGPEIPVSVALGSALWLLNLSDRAPDRHEVALPKRTRVPVALKRAYRTVHHNARLKPLQIRDMPVHRAATVLIHLASRPTDVRSWGSVLGVLPDILAHASEEDIVSELRDRTDATRVRFAYLVSGIAPDLVERLSIEPGGKVWFGPRGPLLRHDAHWQVADTILPFPPPAREGHA
ncbi:MAG: type IV toxin-antitoxin system AbiEi family antitoxin [Longimicrobiales bacterium]|nr:type IV toxin-antitoxin system AbiEi family antitoxin [Longimicrobiales bacterium]